MKRALLVLAALAIGFGAITAWALESGGVARIETRASDGAVRTTHVWYVTPDGELWLEAGAPENGWYRDVRAGSSIELEAGGERGCYRAAVVDTKEAQARVRRLLREKYRWRDRWVGLFVASERSIAVRLAPEACG